MQPSPPLETPASSTPSTSNTTNGSSSSSQPQPQPQIVSSPTRGGGGGRSHKRAPAVVRDLQGRVALVTGATSGLGMEAAVQLAERGARVVFGVRNPAKAERVVAGIRKRYADDKNAPNLDFVIPPAVPPLDLSQPASVTRFARAMLSDTATPLHILINNAGSSLVGGPVVNDRGVNALVQINYLGAYQLTRLLEAKLVASGARVVTVASVTHRCYEVPADPRDFLHSTSRMTYAWSKLANVLFAYELQRRLGPLGVQSCAVDPGGVRTSIWDEVPALAVPPARWVIEAVYAPPEDGAEVLVAAATVPWERDLSPQVLSPAQDLRYYARGAFASPLVTLVDGAWKVWSRPVKPALYGTGVVLHSLIDYPVRHWSGARLFNQTVPVRSAPQTYDSHVAAALWSYSEKAAGLTEANSSPPPPLAEAAAHVEGAPAGLRALDTAGTGGKEGEDLEPSSPQAAAAVSAQTRKRAIMSPVQTFVSLPRPNYGHMTSSGQGGLFNAAGPNDAAGDSPGPSAAAIQAAVAAAAGGGAAGGRSGSATRRRLVAARRDSDAEDADGGGVDAVHGVSALPPVEVPPPPEALQHLAAERGIVLPGPTAASAEEGAAGGEAAAAAREGGGGGGGISMPRFGENMELSPREAEAAPPPYKRPHVQGAADAGEAPDAVVVVGRGGGDGAARPRGGSSDKGEKGHAGRGGARQGRAGGGGGGGGAGPILPEGGILPLPLSPPVATTPLPTGASAVTGAGGRPAPSKAGAAASGTPAASGGTLAGRGVEVPPAAAVGLRDDSAVAARAAGAQPLPPGVSLKDKPTAASGAGLVAGAAQAAAVAAPRGPATVVAAGEKEKGAGGAVAAGASGSNAAEGEEGSPGKAGGGGKDGGSKGGAGKGKHKHKGGRKH